MATLLQRHEVFCLVSGQQEICNNNHDIGTREESDNSQTWLTRTKINAVSLTIWAPTDVFLVRLVLDSIMST